MSVSITTSADLVIVYLNPKREIAVFFAPLELLNVRQFSNLTPAKRDACDKSNDCFP